MGLVIYSVCTVPLDVMPVPAILLQHCCEINPVIFMTVVFTKNTCKNPCFSSREVNMLSQSILGSISTLSSITQREAKGLKVCGLIQT